jgi:hypothetical protein
VDLRIEHGKNMETDELEFKGSFISWNPIDIISANVFYKNASELF